MSIVQRFTHRTLRIDTGNANSTLDTAPHTTTLAAAITTTTQTAITLTSGTFVVDGAYISVGSAPEKMLVISHSGGAVVVERDASVATTHSNGETVNLPGKLVVFLRMISEMPNTQLIVRKTTSDINYVDVTASGSDTFPGGATVVRLIDNTSANGTLHLKFPGSGNELILLGSGGGGGGVGIPGPPGGSARFTRVALTGNSTISSPATPANGDLWLVRVEQDATGGWAVTWGTGTDILLGPDINSTINSQPLTMCLITFGGYGGKWYLWGMPILGVAIV